MGLETRRGRQYYYVKVREGDKVSSLYAGSGETALLGYALDLARAKEERKQRAEFRALVASHRREDEQLGAWLAVIGEAVAAALTASGYHRHRGQWRKRRMSKADTDTGQALAQEKPAGVREALARARQSPTPQNLNTLQRALQANRNDWRLGGDIGVQAQRHFLKSTNLDQADRVLLEFGATCLEDELGYMEAPPLEKILIQHVVLCWLRLGVVEQQYTGAMAGSVTLTQGAYWEKRLLAAQRRHLRAIETLAKVRKMAGPLQINVALDGGQQVNIAGDLIKS